MDPELFNVVFSGEVKKGALVDEVQQRLAAIFKMSPEKVCAIFTGRPVTIKSNLELTIAQKYQRAFESAGAICEIIPAQKEPEPLKSVPAENATTTADKPAATKSFPVQPKTSKSTICKPNLSGFWRRILAFVFDTILLGVWGTVLGVFFFDQFAQMGQFGRLVGFVFAILYFGLLNSAVGKGQTLGKRLMKIRVVDAEDGSHISLAKSAWRYVVLSLPFLCNGLVLPLDNQIVTLLLALVVFGMGGLLFYLYLFNRNTRQSIHDLAAGTLVVQCKPGGRLYRPGIWKGHIVITVLWVGLIAVGVLVGFPMISQTGTFPEMLTLQQELMKNKDIHVASVASGVTSIDGKEADWTAVTIVVTDSEKMGEATANQVAYETFAHFPSAKEKDLLRITVNYGYDIGISSRWQNDRYSYPPETWESAIHEQQARNPNVIVEKQGNITNLHVEGSLGKSHDLPCITIDQAKNIYTPADLYASAARCVMDGRDSDGAQIFYLASVYAVYDASRVSDKTASGARQVLILNNFGSLDQEKRDRFTLETEKIKDNNTQKSKDFCRKVKNLGKPDYHPQYMILHGMSNFLDGPEGDGLISDYDPNKNWDEALSALTWCND
ncbi:RDD family protein [Desulfuromonas sp. KJ2020]|uniref:RDD family protein n=1 Tax=Desulfuromonas sp. KJ2020 TaxID=2919173 RepID=UPI0020A7FA86|nr:RDD family protein [Desulfuromonas sp. KJ2020]MCP3178347.1 RDD family protein [Desulfuromonas sp. KJ2020]